MAGLQPDTSSYGGANFDSYKQPLPVSPLDVAGKLGSLKAQQLGISQAKLDQANQGLTYLTRAMASLGPNPGPDWKQRYMEVGQNAVKMGLVPSDQLNIWSERVNAAPDSNTFFNQLISAAQQHQQILQNYRGTPTTATDNKNIYGGVQGGLMSPNPGGFAISSTLPVQLPPTTPTVDNRPTVQGPNGAPIPNPNFNQPGVIGPSGSPGSLPVARPIPGPAAIPGQSGNFGGRVVGATSSPPVNAATGQPLSSGGPVPTGPAPSFEPGLKLYMNDQANATNTATALKPLEEAYTLAKQVQTGPGTETYNKARTALIQAGLINAKENDPSVIYAIINKNLAQSLDAAGSHSDAAQALKESASPNAKVQIQPAILHIIEKNIARQRIQIARPQAFEGGDYSKYIQHSSTFPQSQDERAYSIDKMPPDEARNLYESMKAKVKTDAKGNVIGGDPEAVKFMKSFATAIKTGQITGASQ